MTNTSKSTNKNNPKRYSDLADIPRWAEDIAAEPFDANSYIREKLQSLEKYQDTVPNATDAEALNGVADLENGVNPTTETGSLEPVSINADLTDQNLTVTDSTDQTLSASCDTIVVSVATAEVADSIDKSSRASSGHLETVLMNPESNDKNIVLTNELVIDTNEKTSSVADHANQELSVSSDVISTTDDVVQNTVLSAENQSSASLENWCDSIVAESFERETFSKKDDISWDYDSNIGPSEPAGARNKKKTVDRTGKKAVHSSSQKTKFFDILKAGGTTKHASMEVKISYSTGKDWKARAKEDESGNLYLPSLKRGRKPLKLDGEQGMYIAFAAERFKKDHGFVIPANTMCLAFEKKYSIKVTPNNLKKKLAKLYGGNTKMLKNKTKRKA
ncbi:hypothetical protein CANARDRAFT_28831 [[Candida] arabinofermentans NRRL YB-2248]|uniref:Uncharacterized protein n=1 Tax=[Candida] arabinofermentans NRRL YB-2248 TaxID=983967 RepID=A0A1E4SYV6_9ASCO|nr:hypothetical protein CANARDRAFT_28831 [[Candida] arabinofermentans NRRL YB-2248]